MSEQAISGLEKAAVLLKSLAPAVVENVLKHLEPRQASRLAAEIARVERRTDLKEATARVLDEAARVLVDKKPADTGKQVDVRVPATANQASADPNSEKDPLRLIAGVPAEALAAALEAENSRTVSLLMRSIDVETAGRIFKRLTPPKRKEVSLRFTESISVSDDLVRQIADAVLRKCQTQATTAATATASDEQAEREKRIAGLLRSLERQDRLEMLTALEEADAALAARVKAMLYLFEDILRMENTSIQKLLSEVDMKTLASALFKADPEISERILANLSRRAKESLKEEIDLTGNVPSATVRQSRQLLEEAMQRLDQRGDFLLKETS